MQNNTDNNRLLKKRFILAAVLLPVLSLGAVLLCSYFVTECTGFETVSRIAFALSFCFVELFYIETFKERILKGIFPIILVSIGPAFIFFTAHTQGILIPAIIVLLFTVLIAGCTDYILGTINLVGACLYFALFSSEILEGMTPYLFMAFILCILSFCFTKGLSLLYSIIITAVSFCIITIVTTGFVLENAFVPFNAILLVYCILLNILVYFIRKNFPEITAEAFEGVVLKPAGAENAAPAKNPAKKTEKKQTSEELSPDLATAMAEAARAHEEQIKAQSQNAALRDQITALKSQNSELSTRYRRLSESSVYDLEYLCSEDSKFCAYLKDSAPKAFRHCTTVAGISADASDLIGCNNRLTYALGILHEAPKTLGERYAEILSRDYHISTYIISLIGQMQNKNNEKPLPREAAIVMLSNDIADLNNYVRAKKEEVPTERIVLNTFNVRKKQNFFRYAGFSNEEVQLLKLYYDDKGDVL